MKKAVKLIGVLVLIILVIFGIYYMIYNEPLPEGKTGKKADELANKMLTALNYEAYENTETLEWSFRNKNHYKWFKNEHIVEVSWNENKVLLNTKNTSKSTVFVADKRVENNDLLKKAIDYFNNDSFWLVAPYKIFDKGTERRIVNYKNQEALLITYTSGGSTPGDSYLWVLDKNYLPTSFKMWTSILPIGGVSATWSDLKETKTGIKLPTKHQLSLFGLEIDMGNVSSINSKADSLANMVLKAINHQAYKNTRYLEWSFAGKRHFKWYKKEHIVDVYWDTIQVKLYPENIKKSTVSYNNESQKTQDSLVVKKAWHIFNNDSFWMVAPHKLFDKGTIRSYKRINDKNTLLVKYTQGGSTPGDSYLWILDENNIPESYKMTVPSMKMKEVSATWQDWITTKSGTLLSTNHQFDNGRFLKMENVKGYN